MSHLTVEQLNDVIQSQLCLYGNLPLVVSPNGDAPEFFELFVGEDSLLECVCAQDSIEEYGLEAVAERLSKMNDNAIILSSHNTPFDSGFRIGIKTKEDGFVTTIFSKELIQPTKVLEN
jgi:hypothetical protein